MLVAVPDVARGPQLNSDTAPSDDVIDSILDLVDTVGPVDIIVPVDTVGSVNTVGPVNTVGTVNTGTATF